MYINEVIYHYISAIWTFIIFIWKKKRNDRFLTKIINAIADIVSNYNTFYTNWIYCQVFVAYVSIIIIKSKRF